MKLNIFLFLFVILSNSVYANLYDDAMELYNNQNFKAALNEFEPLAYIGNSKAQNMAGYMYHHGEGTKVNLNKAVEFYGMAAENGTALSQYNLGVLYRDTIKNNRLAEYWYSKSANQGDEDAIRNLVYMYTSGESDFKKDFSKARFWIELARKKGISSHTSITFDRIWKKNKLWKF